MKLNKLLDRYTFHESTVCNVTEDRADDVLVVDIWLCIWAQEWASENEHKNGMLRLTFSGSICHDLPLGDVLIDNEILRTEYEDGCMKIILDDWKDGEMDVIEYYIKAESVTDEFIHYDWPW